MKIRTRNTTLLMTFGLIVLLGYQNCSDGYKAASSSLNSVGELKFNLPEGSGRLVKTAYSENMLENMVSVSGARLTSASTASLNFYFGTNYVARNGVPDSLGAKSRINETGEANGINATMWMTLTNLAGEVCDNVVTQEKAATAANRRFFNRIDFARSSSVQAAGAVDDSISRLGRSFWGREPSAQEKAVLAMGINQVWGTLTDVPSSTSEALALCTAMLASLDAQKL